MEEKELKEILLEKLYIELHLFKDSMLQKTKKEIKRANQEYKETILPYVLQMIVLDEKVIHGIRDAICIEFSIPRKYMYSDKDLMNILMYDIVKTRYSTEEHKTTLIEHICKMFSFDKDSIVDVEKNKDHRSNKLGAFLGTGIGFLCIISMVIIYYIKPEALNDPNGVASTVIILLLLIAMISFTIVAFTSMDEKLMLNRGMIGILLDSGNGLIENVQTMLYGKRDNKDE